MWKPGNIIWSYPWVSFCVGFSIQPFGYNARAVTICLGPLTLRWFKR